MYEYIKNMTEWLHKLKDDCKEICNIHWGECEVVRLFLNNRLFNQELLFEMGDYHGR
jgi:hypothetical protein